jgi:hypothetical protein
MSASILSSQRLTVTLLLLLLLLLLHRHHPCFLFFQGYC